MEGAEDGATQQPTQEKRQIPIGGRGLFGEHFSHTTERSTTLETCWGRSGLKGSLQSMHEVRGKGRFVCVCVVGLFSCFNGHLNKGKLESI